MAADEGPCHGPSSRLVITVCQEAAVVASSPDNDSQAAAAASIGPEPGPAYISAELISGGKAPKSIRLPYLADRRDVGGLGRRIGPGAEAEQGRHLFLNRDGLRTDVLVELGVVGELRGGQQRYQIRGGGNHPGRR